MNAVMTITDRTFDVKVNIHHRSVLSFTACDSNGGDHRDIFISVNIGTL